MTEELPAEDNLPKPEIDYSKYSAGDWLAETQAHMLAVIRAKDEHAAHLAVHGALDSLESFCARMADGHPDLARELAEALDARDAPEHHDLAGVLRGSLDYPLETSSPEQLDQGQSGLPPSHPQTPGAPPADHNQ